MTDATRTSKPIAETRLAKYVCELVDGWGEPRHDKRVGFKPVGLTVGDVYEFVDVLRASVCPVCSNVGGTGQCACPNCGRLAARAADETKACPKAPNGEHNFMPATDPTTNSMKMIGVFCLYCGLPESRAAVETSATRAGD